METFQRDGALIRIADNASDRNSVATDLFCDVSVEVLGYLPSTACFIIDLREIVHAAAWCSQPFGSWQADLDRLFVIRCRTIKFTRSLESFTATVVRCGVPGVCFNRVGVIRDRRIDLPLRTMSEAAHSAG
jgi:hypothetical protein